MLPVSRLSCKRLWLLVIIFCPAALIAQRNAITVNPVPGQQKVSIAVGGKPFTDFVFTDTMEKPVLYPIYAADGQSITRGYPWYTQPNDPTDHPHHIGLWLNYEKVNGLDFWNNSFAISPDKKKEYGWIANTRIISTQGSPAAKLVYQSDWTNQQKEVLLQEKTTFLFEAGDNVRVIDRVTELTAMQDVTFPDAKDGLLGLRVAHELELPVTETRAYKDDKGNVTTVTAPKDITATGNYVTSAGKEGDSAWGTRGNWCMLYGRKGGSVISIAIIDHPSNPGYPTYWHARNYGLFAANPLGQKVFSNNRQSLNFKLAKGGSATFRYRIVISSGKQKMPQEAITQYVKAFEAADR